MRTFIDLGAFTGDTIEMALKKFKKIDQVYAFEPLRDHFEALEKKFGSQKNVFLINAAADVLDGEADIFGCGESASLISGGAARLRY